MIKNYIFIAGGGSSGTHMLAIHLSKFKEAYCGPEIRITHQPGLYFLDTFKATLFDSLRSKASSHTFTLDQNYSYDIIPKYIFANRGYYLNSDIELEHMALKVNCFFDLIQEIAVRDPSYELSKTTWIEHSPRNCIFSNLLIKQNPNIYIIHLIRDGRDAVFSQYKRFKKSFPYISNNQILSLSAHLWSTCHQGIMSLENHPRVLRIYYEDFVNEPKKYLNAIAQSFSLTETESNAKYMKISSIENVSDWSINPYEEISNRAIGTWKSWNKTDLDYLINLEMDLPTTDDKVSFGELQKGLGYDLSTNCS